MKLDGQAENGPAASDRSELDDGGFVLVAMLIGIAVAAVWMGAALPSWRQQVIREREAELIFRGEQYARAILLFQNQMRALPTTLDDLVSQHFLRKKWKDPISGLEFLPRVGCAQLVPGGGLPGGPGGVPPRGNPAPSPPRGGGPAGRQFSAPPGPDLVEELFQNPVLGRGGLPPGRGTPGVGPVAPGPILPSQPGRGPAPGTQTPGGGFGQTPQGGICGVQSQSKAMSIRIYNGQQQYDLWQFDVTIAQFQYAQNVTKLGGLNAGGAGVGLPVGTPGGLRGPVNRGGQPGQGGPGRIQQPGGGRPFGPSPGGIPQPAPVPGGGQRGRFE